MSKINEVAELVEKGKAKLVDRLYRKLLMRVMIRLRF